MCRLAILLIQPLCKTEISDTLCCHTLGMLKLCDCSTTSTLLPAAHDLIKTISSGLSNLGGGQSNLVKSLNVCVAHAMRKRE